MIGGMFLLSGSVFIVYGADCTGVADHSNVSVGQVGWYSNSSGSSAIDICANDIGCIKKVCVDCADKTLNDSDAKKAFLDFMGYKEEVFSALWWTPSITSTMSCEDVSNFQTSLNSKCSSFITVDGKLWISTLVALWECSICNNDGESIEKTMELDSDGLLYIDWSCSDGYSETGNGLCCQKDIACDFPLEDNNGVCAVDEVLCEQDTISEDWKTCTVTVTKTDGTEETRTAVPIKSNTTTSPTDSTSCSQWALTDDVDSCCDGYTEVTNDDGTSECKECGSPGVCCGVKLNTNVPFIGDCIQFQKSASDPNTTVVGPTTAFPKLMQWLSKLMVTAILVFSFVLLIVAGVMMAAWWADKNAYSTGRKLIVKVIVGIALLGASGIILKLINPNFFG